MSAEEIRQATEERPTPPPKLRRRFLAGANRRHPGESAGWGCECVFICESPLVPGDMVDGLAIIGRTILR